MQALNITIFGIIAVSLDVEIENVFVFHALLHYPCISGIAYIFQARSPPPSPPSKYEGAHMPMQVSRVVFHRSCPPIKKDCCTQDMTAFHSITKYLVGYYFGLGQQVVSLKHYIMIIVSVCETKEMFQNASLVSLYSETKHFFSFAFDKQMPLGTLNTKKNKQKLAKKRQDIVHLNKPACKIWSCYGNVQF